MRRDDYKKTIFFAKWQRILIAMYDARSEEMNATFLSKKIGYLPSSTAPFFIKMERMNLIKRKMNGVKYDLVLTDDGRVVVDCFYKISKIVKEE